jgi:hypothetical protein
MTPHLPHLPELAPVLSPVLSRLADLGRDQVLVVAGTTAVAWYPVAAVNPTAGAFVAGLGFTALGLLTASRAGGGNRPRGGLSTWPPDEPDGLGPWQPTGDGGRPRDVSDLTVEDVLAHWHTNTAAATEATAGADADAGTTHQESGGVR